ncbi:probable inactive shikimate kinase like 1, chloroplastic isoform X1 [Ananas comosus]|uniref:Probable inactive shikimate kinase like 1, chloroplastic isoform X1 n=1 Tax=Ananas comosus TaxID=4615 RepID=A0A6P5GZ44_ANACO|nr:probable inactive shikimate kinase like 1, chloroplastic isoform X1 [Ananas comosus]
MAMRALSFVAPSSPPPSPLLRSNPPRSLSLFSPKSAPPRLRRSSRHHGSSGGSRMSLAELEPSLVVKKKATEISSDLKGTSIFLVGMNCAMKTGVGKLLADALRYYYFDSDSLVEQACGGESSAKLLRESDENGFRDSETEVLKQLSSMGRLLVCAGDGAVESSTNLALLRYGILIWIDVPIELLANEAVNAGASSPSETTLDTSNSDSFLKVLDELSQRYIELKEGYGTADATVSLQKIATKQGYEDLDSVTTEDMALETLKEIERLTRLKKMMEAAARPF